MADDYVASSSTTGSVAVGTSTTGRLEVVGDRDWFSILLAAGNDYSFMLDAAAIDGLQDPYLRLFSSAGTLLSENDDANGLDSQIDISITATGTYYLEAGSGTNPDEQVVGSGMGNYVLSASTPGDDYSAKSSTTGRITVGGTAVGQLEETGDSDWFAISLSAGKHYLFTLESGATDGLADPFLSLYKSNGTLAASNDDNDADGGLNSLIDYTTTTSGTYYLGASSGEVGGGTGSYTVNAALAPADVPGAGDDYSANVSTTGRIAVGEAASGQLEDAGDSDWFAISLSAGKAYVFTLEEGATDGLADPSLSLYRSDGSLVASNDDSDSNGLNSEITITAATTGTYYLGASSGTVGDGTGSYTLNAALATADGTPSTVDDYSSNVSTTGRITAGGTASGQLEETADSDWFAISLSAGKQYIFTLESDATDGLADPFLKLYKSDGSLVTFNDDASADGLNSEISVRAPTTGTYYLAASSGENGSGTGAYVLNASLPMTDDYSGTVSTTGKVVVGSSISGKLEIAGDSDWFAVSLTEGEEYTFALDSSTTDGLDDPFLSLYRSNSTLVATDDDSNAPNAILTYAATATGTYYLEASSSPNDTGTGRGGYQISATLSGARSATSVSGSSGADTIVADEGDQEIDGDLGIDTVVFGGSYASYSVAPLGTGFSVAAGTGTSTLANVERLQFSDVKLAIDMDISQPGGEAALLIGAVLGKSSLTNMSLVGQLLPFFDAGNTLADAANVLVNAGVMDRLAGDSSTNAYVNMIYKAVVGADATPGVTASLAPYIDSGSYSKAEFLTVVSGLQLNQDNIGLVGLQQTGIVYT